jgi:adenine-specific DNA-methyltransferase
MPSYGQPNKNLNDYLQGNPVKAPTNFSKTTSMNKLKMHSPNLSQENISKIRELFPACVTEARDEATGTVRLAVDFDQLRQELSDESVEGSQERYRLDWPGKRNATLLANSPTTQTLRPLLDESVEFETARHLVIESDNIDALRMLQDAYLGACKAIYIDPPYNTGSDFIYQDSFATDKRSYGLSSGVADSEGRKLVANTNANGRFHSDWLSMIYPALKIARSLLTEDGLIFISIDQNEVYNLQRLACEVFGENNFLNDFIWVNNLKGRQISGSGAARTHEHVLLFAKNAEAVGPLYTDIACVKRLMPSVYRGFDYEVEEDERGPYVIKNELYNTNSKFNEDTRPNLVYKIFYNPATGAVDTGDLSESPASSDWAEILPHSNNNGRNRYHAWRWGRDKVKNEYFDLLFKKVGSKWKVYTKVRTVNNTAVKDLIMDISTQSGSRDCESRLGESFFDFPKPVDLVEFLLGTCTSCDSDHIVLDFFAGSGTTGEAVLRLNSRDGGNRRFILVQAPVLIKAVSLEDSTYSTIADITRQRIRAVIESLNSPIDSGFRSLLVDSSNMKDVYYLPDQLSQANLLDMVDNVKEDRTGEDLLFQVLIDWGVDLTLPIRRRKVQDKTVFFVDDNSLIACFESTVTEDLVKELASLEPLRVVFRDNGFVSDAVKINVEQIFRQLSPTTEVKAI